MTKSQKNFIETSVSEFYSHLKKNRSKNLNSFVHIFDQNIINDNV